MRIITLAFIFFFSLPAAAQDRGSVRVDVLDIGQGDSILLDMGYRRAGCEVEWLVDAGPSPSQVFARAHETRCHFAAFVLTHPHADHYAGARAFLSRGLVDAVYTNGETRGPPRDATIPGSWATFVADAASDHLPLHRLAIGQSFEPAPGRHLEVLWSGGHFPDRADGDDINNDSAVLMLSYAGRRILLCGDIETEAQNDLVQRYCTPAELRSSGPCEKLRADVMKVPHHGSDRTSARFLEAVHPQIALISAGYRNREFHLPRVDIVRALQAGGARVLSTSAEGVEDVVVSIAADGTLQSSGPTTFFAWAVHGHTYRGVTVRP